MQVHKGSLAKLQEEYNDKDTRNDDGDKLNKPKVTAAVTKTEFMPVIEREKKLLNEKENEKQFIDNKIDIVENKNEYNKIIDKKEINNREKNDVQIVPPKPLPRASRTGSICEPIEDLTPKPVARPRINSCVPIVTSVNPNVPIAGGYKVPTSNQLNFLFCSCLCPPLCVPLCFLFSFILTISYSFKISLLNLCHFCSHV